MHKHGGPHPECAKGQIDQRPCHAKRAQPESKIDQPGAVGSRSDGFESFLVQFHARRRGIGGDIVRHSCSSARVVRAFFVKNGHQVFQVTLGKAMVVVILIRHFFGNGVGQNP